jgi:hypothetical protein
MSLLYSQTIRPGVVDSLCWTPSCRGLFEVRSFYTTLISPHPPGIFPWKSVWKAKVPSRVAFFVWTAALGKILTTENLRKRRVTILDWCCMCKSSGESVNHLLVHCPVAWELWSLWFWSFLVRTGLCLGMWWTFSAVGKGFVAIRRLARSGKWFRTASCGVFGRNVMTELLMRRKELSQLLNSTSFTPSSTGQRHLI